MEAHLRHVSAQQRKLDSRRERKRDRERRRERDRKRRERNGERLVQSGSPGSHVAPHLREDWGRAAP